MARGRRILLPRCALHGADRLGLSDRRRALSLEHDPRRQGLGLDDRVVQPRGARLRHRSGGRGDVRTNGSGPRPTLRLGALRADGDAPDRRSDAHRSLASALQSRRHSRRDRAHRLQRLSDPRRGPRANGGVARSRAGAGPRSALHVHEQQRRERRRDLARELESRLPLPARAPLAGLHDHGLRRVRAHFGRDRRSRP